MKYKVGDKVRVRRDLVAHRRYNDVYCNEAMTKAKGEIVTIKRVGGIGYSLYEHVWLWTDDMLEPINSHKIVITTDGVETLARLYDGEEVVKTATAKCAPGDEFNFETGAKIAFDRLVNKRKAKVGEYVRVVNKECGHHFEIGDVVRCCKVECDGDCLFEHPDTQDDWYLHPDEYIILENYKPEAKFKVGDRVKFISNGDHGLRHCFPIGSTGTVKKVKWDAFNKYYEYYCDNSVERYCQNVSEGDLKLAPKLYNGKVVCVDNTIFTGYTVGKIYKIVDGTFTDDNGSAVFNENKLTSFEDLTLRSFADWIEVVE